MPPDLSAVFAHVDAHRDDFVARLIDYARHPSISAQNIGIREVALLVAAELARLGMRVEMVPTAGHPVVLGRHAQMPGLPTILLYGHYDVQPADPLDQWLSPPFEPAIRNGRIYGRGIGDNKGQHFAQILALESLLATRTALPCNVILLLEGEEEIGSPRMADFVREHRDALRCDLVITADGPIHESGRPCVEYGVRGVLSFDLVARGANHDLHSGNWGGIAPNPIWSLVHLLASMKDADGAILIDGFNDRVLAPSARELEALRAMPEAASRVMRELELTRLDAPADRGFYERTMFRPTLTINGFHAGYGGPGSKTVLPSEAIAKCDIRLVENMTVEDTFAKLAAHVGKHAPEVRLVHRGGMEPSRTPLDAWFSDPIRDAILAAQGEEPLIVPSAGGSLPDYVFTKILGVPAVTVPYANADEANHAPNENLEIERFIKGVKTGAAMLDFLAHAHRPAPR